MIIMTSTNTLHFLQYELNSFYTKITRLWFKAEQSRQFGKEEKRRGGSKAEKGGGGGNYKPFDPRKSIGFLEVELC